MVSKVFFNNLIDNYGDSYWWRNVLTNNIISPIQSWKYSGTGDSIFHENWDNLIVLDACRSDLFKEVEDTSKYKKYREIKSLGSATVEWVENNFKENSYSDIIYINSNPWVTKKYSNTFYKCIDCWKNRFNEHLKTVHPSSVNGAVREHYEDDKKIIIHYMQPHHPFIDYPELNFGSIGGIDNKINNDGVSHIWEVLAKGFVSKDEVWEGYRSNLEIVMDHVHEISEFLSGKTVVTSDHGNQIGERVSSLCLRLYGHPVGIYSPELRNVPWAVLHYKGRRDTTKSNTTQDTSYDEDLLNDRLSNLGYK